MADGEGGRHTPSGDLDALKDYIASVKKVERLQTSGKESNVEKKAAEEKVANSEEAIRGAEEALNAAKEKLKKIQIQHKNALSGLEDVSSIVKHKATEFAQERDKRDLKAMDYHSSIPIYEGGLSKESWSAPPEFMGPGKDTITIRTLGDVHGWGPGLLSFLLQNELATVSLNGERCESEEKLSTQFPSPFEYDSNRIFISGPWFDCSPFITPGNIGKIFRGQVQTIDITPSDNLITDSIFIQVGDLIDRGDYSELTLESMRQLIQKSPGCTLSLVGNHEGFLIDDSFKGWLKNEKKHKFNRSHRNIAGTIRLDPKRAGSQLEEDGFQKSVFSSYSAHYAHLLLTQEYRLRMSLDNSSRDRLRLMTQPSLDLASIDDRELERIATSNEWSVIERSLEWLNAVREEEASVTLAGALCMFSVGNSLFLHAESNALLKVTDEDWLEFSDPFKTKNGADYRMLFYATADKTGTEKVKPRHYPLLWSRSPKTRWLLNEVSTDTVEASTKLVRRLPWITQIYHGHTPIKKVHTLDIDIGNANLRVTNLDWSWTPPYLSDARDKNPYSVKRKVQYETLQSIGRTALHTKVKSLNPNVTAIPFIEEGSTGSVRIGRKNICRFKSLAGEKKETHAEVKSPNKIVGYSDSKKIQYGTEFKGVLGSKIVLVINQQKKKKHILSVLGYGSHYDEQIAIIYDDDDQDWVDRMIRKIIDEQLKDQGKRLVEVEEAEEKRRREVLEKKKREHEAQEKKKREHEAQEKKKREHEALEKKKQRREALEKEKGESEAPTNTGGREETDAELLEVINEDEKKNGD